MWSPAIGQHLCTDKSQESNSRRSEISECGSARHIVVTQPPNAVKETAATPQKKVQTQQEVFGWFSAAFSSTRRRRGFDSLRRFTLMEKMKLFPSKFALKLCFSHVEAQQHKTSSVLEMRAGRRPRAQHQILFRGARWKWFTSSASSYQIEKMWWSKLLWPWRSFQRIEIKQTCSGVNSWYLGDRDPLHKLHTALTTLLWQKLILPSRPGVFFSEGVCVVVHLNAPQSHINANRPAAPCQRVSFVSETHYLS